MAHSGSIRASALALTLGTIAALTLSPRPLPAQSTTAPAAASAAPLDTTVPDLSTLVARPTSELRDVIERYATDRGVLLRRYDAPYSAERRERMRSFYRGWQARLQEVDFDALGLEGRIDYHLLATRLRYELELLDREERLFREMEPLIPYAGKLVALQEARRRREMPDPMAVAETLDAVVAEAAAARRAADAGLDGRDDGVATSKATAFRAAAALESIRSMLESWYRFHAGYDPLFTWWVAEPYGRAVAAIEGHIEFLRERVVGIRAGEDPIIGDPIGADGMRADLEMEMIAYSPAELVAIAESEFAALEAEMKKASREMGYGDDWKAALEKVKTLHVEPGRQPELTLELAREAVAFIEKGGYVTLPPLADEVWRMEMLSPAQQKVAPFFLGGEVVRVAFPTDAMAHGDKLMSMRGNNVHFSRAVLHHELIPGHHLQGFMTQRHNAHRRNFSTPFWTEGLALYWEMFLWDEGFPRSPEDRIGMLFWRMHRAARIIFSLNFHLGRMTPEEAIDFLVDRVGHERANAEAEVRRSFIGTYPPLYQAAYMLGGLQIRALYRELVESGRMTVREFHDAIYEGGTMPITMVRARLTGQELRRDGVPPWKFAGDVRVAAGPGRE